MCVCVCVVLTEGLGNMAKISYPNSFHGMIMISILFVYAVFHIGYEYSKSYAKFRATVLQTCSAYIWFLVPEKDFVWIYELLNSKSEVYSKCVL